MNHGYFLHKCYMVGRPFWAMRAHSPFLLLIHSRSAPLSVPKLLGDLYAQSSPAFPEQGLSGQVTCAHWEPWAVQALPVNQRDRGTPEYSPSLRVLGHQAGAASVFFESTASGMAFLASHVTPNVSSRPAVKTQICGSSSAWLSVWHLCPGFPSRRQTLWRTLGERARAEIQH